MHKLPNLWKSRHGVYYFRYQDGGREAKCSLHTKDWHRAKLLAFQLHTARDMTIRKLDIEVSPDGTVKVSNINSEKDLSLLEQMSNSDKLKFWLGKADTHVAQAAQAVQAQPTPAAPPAVKTKAYSVVVSLYMDEKKLSLSGFLRRLAHKNQDRLVVLLKRSSLLKLRAAFNRFDVAFFFRRPVEIDHGR